MGNKIVIDACVAIDLNAHKVDFLGSFLDVISDDTIYISQTNFEEIFNFDIRQKLKSSAKVSIHKSDASKFEEFSAELECLKINMSSKDRHVLFLAKEINAEYVVSSDLNVFDKTDKYKKHKSSKYLNPFTTIALLEYLYKRGNIEYDVFFEKALYLFKSKEIDNLFDNHLIKQNLNTSKDHQLEIINDCKDTFKQRFESYRRPLNDQFTCLWSKMRVQI